MSDEMKSILVLLFFSFVVAEGITLKAAIFRHHIEDEANSDLRADKDVAALKRSALADSMPGKCCHSDSLQGTAYIYGPTLSSTVVTRFYYDRQNCRLALVSRMTSSRFQWGQRTVVQCVNGGRCIVANINDRWKQCRVTINFGVTLDHFWTRCISNGATIRNVATLGGDNMGQPGLKVVLYELTDITGQYTRIVTAAGCNPVADIVDEEFDDASVFFFNVTSQIKDKKVFAVPPFCLYGAK